MLKNILKLSTILFVAFFSKMSNSKIIDLEPFKKSVVHYCSKEANLNLKKICLVDSGNRLSLMKDIIQTEDGLNVVKVCSNSLDMTKKESMYEMLVCITEKSHFINTHPDTIYFSWDLRKNELRSEWLTRCAEVSKTDVSSCLVRIERAFNYFWRDYASAKNKEEVSIISRCVAQDFKKTNFLNYLSCRDIVKNRYDR